MIFLIKKFLHGIYCIKKRFIFFLSVLGPGIIVMVADNDAGGISTYALTGAKYGFSLLWIYLILIPITYYIQEMTVRLGTITKKGHAESIFEGFGSFWGWFALIDLTIINWLTLITEYIGMIAAMNIFGIPSTITFLIVTIILLLIVLTGKYWTFEKIALFFIGFNFVYIPAAIWSVQTLDSSNWIKILNGLKPNIYEMSNDFLFIILANIGTTIAPWQIFFQQSAIIDKGLEIHNIKFGKIDTLIGSILTCIIAIFIVITTGAAFFYHNPPIIIKDAAQAAEALVQFLPAREGLWARRLFAIGLFDAGFLGALCISLSTSWAYGEVFGWTHSLNFKFKEAPWFYIVYFLLLISAGIIVLIPRAPLFMINMFVQIISVTLLPISLIFMIILLNDKCFMYNHISTVWQNIVNWFIVIITIIISSLMVIDIVFKT